MPRILRILQLLAPWIILGCYGAFTVDQARYLDSDFRYIQPTYPRAPEDILGLGFWPTWITALTLVSIAGFIAYRGATRRPAYFFALTGAFLIVSALDYFLYETLSEQLLR